MTLSRVLLAGLLLLAAPASLAAQNPPARPDTVPRPAPADTVRLEGRDTATFRVPPGALPGDTVPNRGRDTTAVDSIVPAPLIPAWPQPDSAGFWHGTWVWDQEALARFHGTSLLDLLATVPGIVITRGGGYGQPAGVAPWGLGGGRTRFFYDGWEVDPLASATLDLQEISLIELEEVRVVRRLNEVRVELLPYRLSDRRPYSLIELGAGDPDTRLLRGLFGTVLGARQTLTVGFDVADTEGRLRREPFAVSNLFARWGYRIGSRAGVQVEYRTTDAVRQDSAYDEEADRNALWVRGRFLATPGFSLEALAGRNWRVPADRDRFSETQESSQAAVRALLGGRAAWLEGVARVRSEPDRGFTVPTTELEARAGLRAGGLLELQGSARATGGEEPGTALQGSVRAGPAAGFSAFGSVTAGTRGVPLLLRDSVNAYTIIPFAEERADTVPLFGTAAPSLSGFRAGAEWSRPGAIVGGAFVRLDEDLVPPFGLRLDDDLGRATAAGPSTGVEAYVSTPLLRSWLRLEGWYTRWTDTGGRPFLPEDQGRAALEFHDVFYTGNLEPTLRVEVVRRGAALVPQVDPDPDDEELPAPLTSEPYTLVNAFLQVRVIDVRAFLIAENVFDLRTAGDLPTRPFPRARIIYGIRWHFRN
ncbi:MAG TPA: TonB-dependent receptor plug domain-containing protein [Longimicrobiaceae bacterium]|nr:TonB-dependent receptor plug domain-containing protein [Longimicrobiaceae bacterium]